MLPAMLAGAAINGGMSIMNNLMSWGLNNASAVRNYQLNEQSAINADIRTRKLYNDLQSPKALLQQYKEAGLSPSLMFGGSGAGGSVAQGAQGGGANGTQATTYGMPMIDLVQMRNIEAQTKKTEAETANIEQDTLIKDIDTQRKNLELTQYKREWNFVNSYWTKSDGSQCSIFELATDHGSFDSFVNAVREAGIDNPDNNYFTQTEAGMKILREIYHNANKFERDIATLSQEKVDANFHKKILEELSKLDYEHLNAEEVIAQLKASKAASDLDGEQKQAWLDLLERLGKKGGTTRDIVVVIGMLINAMMSRVNVSKKF